MEREAQRLRMADEPKAAHRIRLEGAVSGRCAGWLRQQAAPLIVTNRFEVHAALLRDLAREAADAPRYIQGRKNVGKVVLTVA